MSSFRTTVTLDPSVYSQVKTQYKDMGFSRVSDLINAAVAQFLARAELRRKDSLMAEAAADPAYLAVLRQVSSDFAAVDAEGWPNY